MRSKSSVNILVVALAAVLAAAAVLLPVFSAEAVYPVEKAARAFRVRVWPSVAGFFRGAAASVENERLKREVAALQVLRTDLRRLEKENARLRAALDYVDARHGEWVAAGVLSSGGAAAAMKNVLRIDKGANDGIARNAAVVTPAGLAGLVTAVTPHTAEVTLLTDESVKVDCEVESAGMPARGVLCGGGEELLRLKYLRNAAEVPPRARVLTSGRGGIFPRGLEVGSFKGVRENASGLLQEGEVIPAVDYRSLEDVFIRREE